MSEADDIALRKKQLMAAKLAQLAKIEAGVEADAPSGPSAFQKQRDAQRALRKARQDKQDALDAIEPVELPPEEITPEDTTKQRSRIDKALQEIQGL